MTIAALSFLNPWLLAGLASLPLIYWLLRTVPPRPRQIAFPPTRILKELDNVEKTPAKTPWWLLLIRLLAAALIIFALASPIYDASRQRGLEGTGPVAIVVDNSWAAAAHWQDRLSMIERFINRADASQRPLIILPTAADTQSNPPKLLAPSEARSLARALEPQSFDPDYERAQNQLDTALRATQAKNTTVIWMHDGIERGTASVTFANALAERASGGAFITLDISSEKQPLGVVGALGENGKLQATLLRPAGVQTSGTVIALSARGERLSEATYHLALGETKHTVAFELPLELRNQVARIAVAGERSAGAVHLLDGRSHWQRVGLISGGDQEQAQPILSPLYYLEKALKPFAEIVRSKNANLDEGLDDLLNQNVTILMLTDIGRLTESGSERVSEWLNKGGVLVRFAGPRLEQGGDDLLPTPLRLGGRTLGGALSWSTPQALAPFEEASLFQGLEAKKDVTVERQVLADPSRMEADVRVLARLQDGTPLVTARAVGQGQVILFHVTANSDWSNLPMSGLFVEMLRRITTLGTLSAATGSPSDDGQEQTQSNQENATSTSNTRASYVPVETLTGFGVLQAPPPTADVIEASKFATLMPSARHPAGYYGAPASPRALNILTPKSVLAPLDISAANSDHRSYENRAAITLKPWLLTAALGLIFADIIALLIMQLGGIRTSGTRTRAKTTPAMMAGIIISAAAVLLIGPSGPAVAQSTTGTGFKAATPNTPDGVAMMATSKVTFGYVLTGDEKTDTTTRQGLEGLGRILEIRTAVEPGAPMGVDIEKDEIAFYPILYWPVLTNAKPLSAPTLAKIDAFMKQGGMIVFDTRDYGAGMPSGVPLSGEGGTTLQRLLGRLDLPRLEPVPEDHVLTKSFYLLNTFPGRFDGGELWVEAEGAPSAGGERKARRADGVSSILITSNDLASAWALDERGRGLFPAVPGGEEQREMAFRTGVNIVMHALTGNYKADQVHVPSLLERLGQ